MNLHRQIVLVAEDQSLIRMEAVEMPTAHGYEVVAADGADEALYILEARATESQFSESEGIMALLPTYEAWLKGRPPYTNLKSRNGEETENAWFLGID